ncbi:MAG TPA: hypothetical protein VF950_08675 [Planctomycetota bacterium]
MRALLLALALQEEIEQVRTKTAYVLDAGEIEVDLVGSFLRFDEDGRRHDRSRLLLEIEAGLTDWLLAEIEAPYLFENPESGPGEHGIGDLELELKARIPGDVLGVEAAVGIEVSLLTGDADEGLGAPETELGAFVGLSRRFDVLLVHLQLGVEGAEERRPEYEVNAAVDFRPWGRPFSFLLALNGEIEPGEGPGWSVVPGFEARFDEIQAGAGFPLGLSEEAEAWGVIVDVEFEF